MSGWNPAGFVWQQEAIGARLSQPSRLRLAFNPEASHRPPLAAGGRIGRLVLATASYLLLSDRLATTRAVESAIACRAPATEPIGRSSSGILR